jgi:hypothetical protein
VNSFLGLLGLRLWWCHGIIDRIGSDRLVVVNCVTGGSRSELNVLVYVVGLRSARVFAVNTKQANNRCQWVSMSSLLVNMRDRESLMQYNVLKQRVRRVVYLSRRLLNLIFKSG